MCGGRVSMYGGRGLLLPAILLVTTGITIGDTSLPEPQCEESTTMLQTAVHSREAASDYVVAEASVSCGYSGDQDLTKSTCQDACRSIGVESLHEGSWAHLGAKCNTKRVTDGTYRDCFWNLATGGSYSDRFRAVCRRGSAALASAVGDPHLVNLRGETFDLNMAGEHLLLQIPQGSGEDLEVVGVVEHLPIQKSGQSPCEQFLFKKFTVRGNYVDAHKGEIVIDAGQNLTLQGFATTHQQHGKTTSTTYDSLLNLNAPTTVGKVQMWACKDSNSKRQRSFCKQLGSMKGAGHRQLMVFTRKASMFVMEFQGAGPLPMHLAFSRFEGASPSFLNLALHGFSPSTRVGGLLGSDDHTKVSKLKANCVNTHHSKERPAARRNAQAHRNAAQTP